MAEFVSVVINGKESMETARDPANKFHFIPVIRIKTRYPNNPITILGREDKDSMEI